MRILVTRPKPEGERTAAALVSRGHDVLLAPMLTIEPVADVAIPAGRYDAIVMTSGNAARALIAHPDHARLLPLPVFTVGHRTAEAARAAGFAKVTSADGDADDLVRLVAAQGGENENLLYLAGSDRARDLPSEFSPHGIEVETVVVYQANAARAFPHSVAQALANDRIDGALHFSRRTAEVFCNCVEAAGLTAAMRRMRHYSLSRRAAEPLAAAGVKDLHVAPAPDEAALLGLIPIA